MIVKGFTTVYLLGYANLEDFTKGFFGRMKPEANHRFELNSKVVTVSVSNRNTSHLEVPVKLTLYHLKQVASSLPIRIIICPVENMTHVTVIFSIVSQTNEFDHTCVFWDASEEGGSWSTQGCQVVESKAEYTVCSCNHLSSFAVLMALYDVEVETLAYSCVMIHSQS